MHMRVGKWLAVLLAALAVCVGVVPSAAAQSKTLVWHRWDVDVGINTDGTFRVVEQHEIEFTSGEFTFGYRNISRDQTEAIRDFVVREGSIVYEQGYSEAPNTFYVSESDGEAVVNWFYPPTSNATRVFTVEYTVVGGLIIGEEGDRFFWKAVAPDHAFPVESSTITVTLPLGATVDAEIAPAFFGAGASYSVSSDRTMVTFVADGPIPANQEFEVGVRFTHGIVPDNKPSWQAAYEVEQTWNDRGRPVWNLALGGLGVLLLVGGPLGLYLLWAFAGRDPKVGPVPTYLSEPPGDLAPGLAGTLLDEKADLQDIIATLVDLARRGAIEIEEKKQEGVFGIGASTAFTFRKSPGFSKPLQGYEQALIDKMFGAREEVRLDDLRGKFYTAIPKIQQELYEAAVRSGFFRSSPKAVRTRYQAFGIAGLVLAMGVGFCVAAAAADQVDTVLCPFISLGITSIGLLFLSRVMPAKTRAGAEEAAKWEAFKTYLKDIERYAKLEEATDQFDRYLPYAVAFGLERGWVNKFSRIEGTPMPGWYIPMGMPHPYRTSHEAGVPGTAGSMRRGSDAASGSDLRDQAARPAPSLDGMADGMFRGLGSMSTGLFSMLNVASSVLSSAPSSSGSSGGFGGGGFSGGGFSGGGGGGGGGAGFG